MKTVLVSGASGVVGYGALRALRRLDDVRLIGTTIYSDSVAPAFCDVFELAPRTSEEGYIAWLLEVLSRHRVDLLIPGIEDDMYKWADHADEILKTGAQPLLNNLDLIRVCKDKWAFYETLRSAGAECAIESSLSDDYGSLSEKFGVPFIVKPRRGFGSKGVARVHSPAQFEPLRPAMGAALMAQPLVGTDDQEYTISAFCDGKGGVHASMAMRRSLSVEGFTEKAEVVSGENFAEAISALCGVFRPLGPTNFQFRLSSEGPKLLEINPRVSSSTSIRAAFGYNECAMAVEFFLYGRTPQQPPIRRGRAVRYVDEVVFYEEDRLHL